MKIHLADIFYFSRESPPSIFPLHFRYIYFLLCIFIKSKLLAGSIPVLNLPEKDALFPLLRIYLFYIIPHLL